MWCSKTSREGLFVANYLLSLSVKGEWFLRIFVLFFNNSKISQIKINKNESKKQKPNKMDTTTYSMHIYTGIPRK